MRTTHTTIDTGWHVRPTSQSDVNPDLQLPPIPAHVPGHVHLDLHQAGVIPDPFYRMQERDVAWVDDTDWTYETKFDLELEPGGDLYLRFLGLDTVAEIFLNERLLGRTNNMFVPHEFDIGNLVRRGENTLAITFRSARRMGRGLLDAWSASQEAPPFRHSLWDARSFVRKAQYMFGWDWGPVLISCGIWRPVELIQVPVARFLDWRYDVRFEGSDASVVLEVEVDRMADKLDAPLTLLVEGEAIVPASAQVPVGEKRSTVSLNVKVTDVRRWSPTEPHLYPIKLTLKSDDITVEGRSVRLGLRTIELRRTAHPDGDGEGFVIRVNGADHFCKGANWIPADSFPSKTYDDETVLRGLLSAARDAGFTMLRVWGGGLYESETFYDLCDELGILVWQDFPYACAYYPDDPDSLAGAAAEASKAVRRIRVHASLALWCGNNENHQMYADNWQELNPPRFLGQAIYETVLPAVIRDLDPATPYWPGSGYGGKHPNSPDNGDRHNWDVWHGQGLEGGDWPNYSDDRARFCSEFGFASSCGIAAWDTCLGEEDRDPQSLAVRWHNKTRKPYDTYLGYIERHFPPVESMEDLVYFSQLNQAEAMKLGVEHYRRLKGRCWGTLIWQLNDCWPVQSWAMLDYLGERKAVYYAARRFYAPVLVSAKLENTELDVHVTNDLLREIRGRLNIRVARFDGTTLHEQTESIAVDANATRVAAILDLQPLSIDERDVYVDLSLLLDKRTQAIGNTVFFCEPKQLRLSDPGLEVAATGEASGPAVSVKARHFAAYVWLSAPELGLVQMSDNFFHLRPGEERLVAVTLSDGYHVQDLANSLRVRTLNHPATSD